LEAEVTYDHTTAAGQLRMQRDADARLRAVCRTFNEIQTGPNPLTPTEVRALIDKRPDVYGVLEAFAAKENQ
jgi:hypothetical protein